MAKKAKEVFETDRRIELRMRLAVKKASENGRERSLPLETAIPPRELVDRVIDRVRQL